MRSFPQLVLLLLLLADSVQADNTYERVKPIFMEKCAACHGALKQEAGLRLDAGTLVHQGGETGKVIVPGEPAESLIIERVSTGDLSTRMPPEGEGEALDAKQLDALRTWIQQGASFPESEAIPLLPSQHWAYQIPQREPLPTTNRVEWSGNPIDAFVAEQHQRAELTPMKVADDATRLRRLYLDLVGLPPSRAQLDAFLENPSRAAYEEVVDHLLESPQYGERWGRHWMDVWRYSDWNGYKNQLRGSQRHIWRWRDWIIASVNADKGYDQMILEMLAGDELAPEDPAVLPATGFLARNFHNSNRNIWLDATVEHTAKAFLGMTINCARCHDHKYDPLAQREYYAFRAVFEPHQVRTEVLPGKPNVLTDGLPRVFDAELEAPTYLYIGGNEKHPEKDSPVAAATPAIFEQPLLVEPIPLPPRAVFPALAPHIEREAIAKAERRLAAAKNDSSSTPETAAKNLAAAEAALRALRARWEADKAKYLNADQPNLSQLAKAAADAERLANFREAEADVLAKQMALDAVAGSEEADAQAKREKADADLKAAQKALSTAEQALKTDDLKYTSVGKSYPTTSTGRRLALARWIAAPKNPLTARVAVNHIWLRHFGEPLVQNVFDFGLRSPTPELQNLLDWLAVEFVEHDWSMKHLHRLIVTSRVYQLASSGDPEQAGVNRQRDPDNRYYWRANTRRLDAEVIRDSVLHASGSLDLSIGGPDIDYAEGETNPRRSVYFRHAYEKQMKMLVLFDAAGPNECYRRSESIIPQQALTLANSPLSWSQARKLASQLWQEVEAQSGKQYAFVREAFRQVLTRNPTDIEMVACLQFLTQQTDLLADPTQLTTFDGDVKAEIGPSADASMRARESLVHVLMNHNDFVTVR